MKTMLPSFIRELCQRAGELLIQCQEFERRTNLTEKEAQEYVRAAHFAWVAAEKLCDATEEHAAIARSRTKGN